MTKLSSTTLALVISAIKNMRESKGSSSRDILNYISSVHDIPQDVAKRQMVAALKRGVAHGIINKSDGYYSIPTDREASCAEVAVQELGLLNMCCRKAKRKSRKDRCGKSSSKRKKRSSCKRRSSRRRGRKHRHGSRSCGRKRRRSRGKKRRSRSKRGCGCKGTSKRGRSRRSRRSKRKSRRAKKHECDGLALEVEGRVKKQRNDRLNIDAFGTDEQEFDDIPSINVRSKSRSRSRSRNKNVRPNP